MTSAYIDNLLWRYATKKFDATKKLSAEQIDALLEATRLSASSYGLQPYKFVIVTDAALRAKIREHSWNQSQVTDASHLIVLCAKRTIDNTYIDKYVARIAQVRDVPVESLTGYRDMMRGSIANKDPKELGDWMKRQTYIALGFLLSAAAQMRIDSCPMEGFDPTHVDVDLGLIEKDLTAVALCPVGFRAVDDATAKEKKVRIPKEELLIFKN